MMVILNCDSMQLMRHVMSCRAARHAEAAIPVLASAPKPAPCVVMAVQKHERLPCPSHSHWVPELSSFTATIQRSRRACSVSHVLIWPQADHNLMKVWICRRSGNCQTPQR